MTGSLQDLSDDDLLREREKLLGQQRHEDLSTRFDTDPSSLTTDELTELRALIGSAAKSEKQQRREEGTARVSGAGLTAAAQRTAASAKDAAATANRARKFTLEGINESIADLAGMPVDLVSHGLKLAGVNIDDPVLGSKQILDVFKQAGIVTGEDPTELADRFAKRIGKTVGSAIGVIGASALAAPRTAVQGVPIIANAFKELLANPGNFARRELGAAAPAGVAAASAEEGMRAANVPEESKTFKIGSFVSELLGGIAGTRAGNRTPSARTPEGREAKVAGVIKGRAQEPGMLDMNIARNQAELEQLSGYRPTTAQASEDTGLLRTERDAKAVVPGFEADLSDRLASQMNAAREELDRIIGPRRAPGQAGREIREDITAARKTAKTDERAAWDKIDPATRTPFDNVVRKLWDIKNGVKEGELASSMPAVVQDLSDNLVQNYGGILSSLSTGNLVKPLESVQSWRSRVGQELRQEQTQLAPDARKIARLEQLQRSLNEAIDDLGKLPGDQGKLVREASKKTRERVQTFDEGAVGRTRQRGSYEGYRVPESDVAEQFVGTGKPQPESFASLVRATGSRSKAVDAAKNILMQNFERAVTTGEGLSLNKLGRFMDSPDNRELLRSVFNTDPNQLARLQVIRRNLESRAQSTNPLIRGQSTTTEKLTGSAGLESELRAPRLLDKILGARLPSVSGQALRVGAAGARGMEDRLKAKQDALTFQLFRDAMLDPQLARDLLRRTGEAADKRTQQRLQGWVARYVNPETDSDEEGEE